MKLPSVTPTALDRVIGYFSPRAGLERIQARNAIALVGGLGGYAGARSDRRPTAGWYPYGGSANADSLRDLPALRSRSRDLDRNAPLASGAIASVVGNVVGTGLWPRPQIDRELLGWDEERADAWEKQAGRLFSLWAGSPECDLTRSQTFEEIQALALRSVLTSGDVLLVKRFVERPGSPFGLKLQVIEADRISNPNRAPDTETLLAGVEVDRNGAPLAFHVSARHPGERILTAQDWARIPVFAPASGRRNAIHLFERLRPDQARGIPFLAPVIEHFRQLSQYSEAEITAAVVNACFAIGIKSEEGTSSLEHQAAGDGGKAPISIVDPGTVIDLAENEEIQSFTPGRPSAAFDPFVTAVVRQIGVALELPYEVLIKHFTASYSASRAALEMAGQFFRRRRYRLTTGLCQPIYEDVLIEAIARGWIQAPGFFEDPLLRAAYCGCDWIGDAPIQLDPVKEATAAEKWSAMGVKTLSEITAAVTGGDWEAKLPLRAKEERKRREAGLGETAAAAPAPAIAAPIDSED